MKKLITFLGTGYYQDTEYRFDNHLPIKAEFFQEALVASEHLDFSDLFVFVTDAARNRIPKCSNPAWEPKTRPNWQGLVSAIEKFPACRIHDVPIKDGKSIDEIWDIFDAIGRTLEEGDEVYFDITHGFRSLPMLCLIAINFFRATKKIKLRGLFYGAFDAKDSNGIAPVFDLTPFVHLLDLTEATSQFVSTGSSGALAEMMRSNGANNSADLLSSISGSLESLRSKNILLLSHELSGTLHAEQPTLSNDIPPARDLLNVVVNSYSEFGMNPDEIESQPKLVLQRHLSLVHWFLEKKQYVHCLSMAREWITSLMCYLFNMPLFVYEGSRDMVEKLRAHDPEGGESDYEFVREHFAEWERHPLRPKIKQTLNRKFKVYSAKEAQGKPSEISLGDLRNDLDHAGFRSKPRTLWQIEEASRQIIKAIDELAKDAGISTDNSSLEDAADDPA